MNKPTLDETVRMVADLIETEFINAVTGVAILREALPGMSRRKCLRLLVNDLNRRVREDRDAEQAMRNDGWW